MDINLLREDCLLRLVQKLFRAEVQGVADLSERLYSGPGKYRPDIEIGEVWRPMVSWNGRFEPASPNKLIVPLGSRDCITHLFIRI
jgi:hypothetical protein